jgi:hypothetical protein
MNYFNLTLDTTGPSIEIYAPPYTSMDIDTEILVESDEQLLTSEVYIIDSSGNRHDYTFSITDEGLEGIIKFSDYPIGFATITITAYDEVLNSSAITTRNINVLETLVYEDVVSDVGDQSSTVKINENVKSVAVSTESTGTILSNELTGLPVSKEITGHVRGEEKTGKVVSLEEEV